MALTKSSGISFFYCQNDHQLGAAIIFEFVSLLCPLLFLRSTNNVIVVTRLFPSDEGMAEDYGAPEAGQLLRVWIRDRRETESRQRVRGAKNP